MDINKTTYAVITGASKGLGRIITVQLAKRVKAASKFVLLARDVSGLEQTKQMVTRENSNITVEIFSVDLNSPNLDEYKDIIANTFDRNYENSVIFHNAGSVGRAAITTELTNLEEWTTFYNLTLFSTTLLNTAFVEKVKDKSKCYVVNISSMASKTPLKGFGLYCSGKAARDLYFGVVSIEEPSVKVLNYSPGAVKTSIFDIFDNASDDLKNVYTKFTFVDGDMTIGWLLNVLQQGNYNSGAFVDYLHRK